MAKKSPASAGQTICSRREEVALAAAGARHDAGRFRGAGDLRRLHHTSSRARAPEPGQLTSARCCASTSAQHPLHLEHGDRRVGARQS